MRWRSFKRKLYLSILIGFLVSIGFSLFPPRNVQAAQIISRSLTLIAGASAGGSDPGGVVDHLLQFTIPSTTSIQSIGFLYCTTASGTCTTPTGLVTTNATLGSTSSVLSGFTLTNTTAGEPYISSSTAYAPSAADTALSVQLDSITNPTISNYTFFVRISTYTGASLSGSVVDTGTVAASTATPIVLTGIMPESLIFCTGGTVGETNSIPDCTTATSGDISFNQLFSPTATATATSQMAASTNASSGYNITVNGTTLTSGSNTIPAMTTAAASSTGSGQFGMNLVANTTPNVGSNITPTSTGVNFKGEPLAGYNTANEFEFNSGNQVANSADGGAGPTDSQIYTVSYIVNVPGNQTAGTYTTTLTYICTAQF